MLSSNRRSPVPENHRAGNASSIFTKKTQIQRLNRGWRCGTNDALMKLPSLSPDSATRFFRTVSFRLATHSAKSQLSSNKKTTEDNLSKLTGHSKTGGGFTTEIDQTTSSSETGSGSSTGNNRTSSGETEKGIRAGIYQTLPSSESGKVFPPRSMSVAAFFRRVQSSHQVSKVEHTKRVKDGDASRSTQSVRTASGKDEVDSGWKRNALFQGLGSMRIQNRNSADYKLLDDGSRPLDVDPGRNSFRRKLRKEVHRPTLRTSDVYEDETARPSGSPRDTRGTVSDGEEEQQQEEDSQSSKGQRNRVFKFQRSSTIWRSFSAKSRTRSNDVLSQTTESGDRDSGYLQRGEIEVELKVLGDLQQHRNNLGFLGEPDGFQTLLTQHRRCVGSLEQHPFRNSLSRVDSNSSCPSPSCCTPTKRKVLGLNDWQRYRHILDGLLEFNMAHGHYTEAAFVLCEHAQLCDSVEGGFQEQEDGEEWRRGEQFLLRAVEEFERGKTWEYAIDICEYLSKIYKAKFMYAELSLLLQKQADLYRKILQEPRPKPCYFMVHFLGGGFPEVLSNGRFVLRTETLEEEYEFSRIISYEFKGANRLYHDLDPHETVTTDIQRGYKLFKLKPVPSMSVSDPGLRKVPDAVQFFHRYNNVSCFEVVASCEGEAKSEVVSIESSLPAISRWAQVKS